jgi:hypothetical protein
MGARGAADRRDVISEAAIAAAIRHQLGARAPLSSICPSEVARALAPDGWRALMQPVREAALAMADRDELRITRGGVSVLRADVHRGAIRLARGPRFDSP